MTELIGFKIIAIFVSFCFIFVAWVSKKITSTWLNPSSIFSLFWFLYTFLPLLLAYETPINPVAVMYILIFCALFASTSLIFNWEKAFYLNENKLPSKFVFGNSLFSISFYIISITTIVFFLIGMIVQGFSFQQMLNPIRLAGDFANMRYSAEIQPNIFSQAGLQGSYIVIVLGGLFYGTLKIKDKRKLVVILLSFTPSLLAMTLQSAKGLFFFSIFTFYGGILVSGIHDKNYHLLTLSVLKKFIFFSILTLPVLISSFVARGLQDASTQVVIEKIRFYLVTYSSGHLYAFSDWFTDRYFYDSSFNYKQENLTAGFYTFMSFFRLFGDEREIPMGTYDEFFQHGLYVKTNLYSVFRGLITDFTLLGSLITAILFGFIVNYFFYRLLMEKYSVLKTVFFIYFLGVAYQSYIISTLMWITIPFIFCVTVLILYIIDISNDSMRKFKS